MILMGVLMFTGKMNDITGYLSTVQSNVSQESAQDESGKARPDRMKQRMEQRPGRMRMQEKRKDRTVPITPGRK